MAMLRMAMPLVPRRADGIAEGKELTSTLLQPTSPLRLAACTLPSAPQKADD